MIRRLVLLIVICSCAFRVSAAESPVTQLRYSPAPVNVLSGITVEPIVDEELQDELTFSYRWLINDEEVDFQDGPFLSGEFMQRGDAIVVEVTAYGMTGEEYEPFVPLAIYVDNAPPQFTKEPVAEYDDDRYRGRVYAEDLDGDEIEFRLISGPEGFELDADSGKFQWQPEVTQGVFPVKIEAVDPYEGRAEQMFDLELSTVRR